MSQSAEDAARARLSRRERLRGAPAGGGQASPPSHAPADASPAVRPHFAFLSKDRVGVLRERAILLLAEHGVVVNHAAAVGRLKEAGARLEGNRLCFPPGLTEAALSALPNAVTLCGRSPAFDITLPRPDNTFTMRTGTGAHGFIEAETGAYRKLVLDDVATIAAVANGLERVGIVAHPFVTGVPELTADIHGVAALIASTPKHVWLQPYGEENTEYLLRIAAVAAGGEAALRARPIVSCIVTSFTPLEFKSMDVEAIIQCGRLRVPIHACSLPTAGGTAPVTMPGVILMAAAEILSMAVMTHVLAPGTPVIATPLIFGLDLRTGRSLQASVEALQGAAIAVQLMKHGFGMITHTYGSGSDTPDVDGQSQAERALLGQIVGLAGADILGGAGQLECATAFSPVQAVLDDEYGAMLQHFLRTPAVDDETLAWQDMRTVKHGGNFLATPHTLLHCRANFEPLAFQRLGREAYEAAGHRTALDRAREICRRLVDEHAASSPPDAVSLREIESIVKAADAQILKGQI
ncbi:MAG TPA: trimethylamine methyltransferase family protein [Alphaproteobacteria bacterium]|nr:trimethylamine methyltransferase family protein [Alphaproteobacteria bacterium]